MNPKERSRWSTGLLLFALVLMFASSASAEWKEKVLYSFQGGTDGASPAGGVVFDKIGNLYGATQQGGGTNCSPMAACGTVYQLSPPAHQGDPWTETLLHVFKGKQHNDGEFPSGGVIADALGNIYGTSSYGGTGDCVLLGIKGGCGTVFELSPPQSKDGQWTYTVLYSFKGGKDGYLPFGDLVFDAAGNLYGATYFGGGKGTSCDPYYQYCGTVFELSSPKTKGGKWTEKVLHSFAGGTDGANPNGGLVLDSKKNIYGTTFGGGNEGGECGALGCGTAFELKPRSTKSGAWAENVLYRFSGHDGANPAAGLVFGGASELYGPALGGGNSGYGAIFELDGPVGKAHSWTETVLHRFSGGKDGANPGARLIFDVSGNLYGTTESPTTQSARGNVFRLRSPSLETTDWALDVVYTFNVIPDGENPDSAMVLDSAGDLYGTTIYGGTGQYCQGGCGTVFEVFP